MSKLTFKKWIKPNTNEVRFYVSGCSAKAFIISKPSEMNADDFEVVFTERVYNTFNIQCRNDLFNNLHEAGLTNFSQIVAAAI